MSAFPLALDIPTRWWIIGGLASLVALLFIGFAVAIFLAAMLEKVYIRRFVLLPVDRQPEPPEKSRRQIEELHELGFQSLGMFSDGDKGIREGIVTLMLSPQGDVLAQVIQPRLNRRLRLMTRLAGGYSVMTSEVSGAKDLSGTREEEMLPESPAGVMLEYHQQRVAARGQPVDSYDSRTVLDELFNDERDRVAKMVSAGFAYFLTPAQDVYRYTFKGALEMAGNAVGGFSKTAAHQKLAKERKAAWEKPKR